MSKSNSQIPSNNNYNNNMVSASAIQNLSNNSLFIGDLSKFCSEIEVEALFAKFGQIIGEDFNKIFRHSKSIPIAIS
jgi:RNA recognition motif-containing protein